MKTINNYLWFIKESQSFMRGHNPVKIFIQSLWKGIGFCRNMNEWDKAEKQYGAETAYCMLNRVMEV